MTMPIRWDMKESVCDAYKATEITSSALHGHHHFLITLITRGNGIQTLNGKDIPFGPDDMFLLSPADFHRNLIAPGESYDYYGVKFPYELLDARLSELCQMDRFPMHVHLTKTTASVMREIFSRLVEECLLGEGRLASRAYLQTLVEQVFILALREMPFDKGPHSGVFVNKALGYLYSHFQETITVNDVASYVGYTPNYFNTRFQELMGIPFRIYLRKMRLTYAENLLKSSTMSVTEVAMEAGFVSLPHFSRCFHAEFGAAPQEYRKTKACSEEKYLYRNKEK